MKITIKQANKIVYFDTLKAGDVFHSKKELFLRVKEENEYNAVSLETFAMVHFDCNEPVARTEAELTVKVEY